MRHTGASSKLRASAWVKAENVHKVILDVQFVDKGGGETHQWAAYIGARAAGDRPANHGWKQYSGVVAIPAGAKLLRIALQIYGPGTVWFDDVSAEYVPDDTPASLYDDKGNPKTP